jgi:hypothetical protein
LGELSPSKSIIALPPNGLYIPFYLYISQGAYTQYIHANYNNFPKFKTQIVPMGKTVNIKARQINISVGLQINYVLLNVMIA